ncbi:MAG: hypothetical protein QNJ62_06140 [Methyloceanibacter sp.]|nr:hypothetical protein [Methyloceanibacter sp.]
MGRQVRMVPKDWQHPKNAAGYYIPLIEGSYAADVARWDEGKRQWDMGFRESWESQLEITYVPRKPDEDCSYEEWDGERPVEANYMPVFEPGTATHLMMYEDTSEGTPISPAFETAEELARWLTDNKASAFGDMTASYEQWLATAKAGWAPSAVISGGVFMSGVEDSDRP